MELLKISFRQPEVVLALAKMVHDVHERSNVQNPLGIKGAIIHRSGEIAVLQTAR